MRRRMRGEATLSSGGSVGGSEIANEGVALAGRGKKP